MEDLEINENFVVKSSEDFMKEISLSSPQELKEEYILRSKTFIEEYNKKAKEAGKSIIGSEESLARIKVKGISFYDILDIQSRMKFSDMHIGRGDYPVFKVNNEQIRVGIEFAGSGQFEEEFWKNIISLEESTVLLFDWLTEKQKRTLLTTGRVHRSFRILRERIVEGGYDPKHPDGKKIEKFIQKFRLCIHLEKGGFAISSRFINASIPLIEEMNVPKIFKDKIINEPSGIVFVCGPTNNGKSFTLSAAIDYINRKKKMHIITVEDPVEVVYEPKLSKITQREVGNDTESYYEGAKDILRMDGNVAVIGEIRYPEELEAAINLATNGLLVFATTHAASAYEMIRYAYDIAPVDRKSTIMSALMDSMKGILCQRLYRKEIEEVELDEMGEPKTDIDGNQLVNVKTKYITAYELLVNNVKLRAGLRPNEHGKYDFNIVRNNLKVEGKVYGNVSINDFISEMVINGEITVEEGLGMTYDRDGFIEVCHSKNIKVDPRLEMI